MSKLYVNTIYPQSGDLVALSRDGELLTSGYTNGFGSVNLELGDAATVPGELDFVVTGFNNFPYETTVMVLSPDGAYVLLDSFTTNDFEGLTFGEDFDLTLSLYNTGSDAFIAPQPEPSASIPYVLNEDSCLWELSGSS